MNPADNSCDNGRMRILGTVLAAVFGAPFLLFAWVALSGRFGPVSGDPHGYGMIFGTLFAVALSIPLILCLPLALPVERRGDAIRWGTVGVLVVDAVLVVALMSA